jgi:hypothetical protein
MIEATNLISAENRETESNLLPLQPTSWTELYPSTARQYNRFPSEYSANDSGKLYVHSDIDCFVGHCCLYYMTYRIIFDDNTRVFTRRSLWGLCFSCCDNQEYRYEDIGNVGMKGIVGLDKVRLFRSMIVMKDRTLIPFGSDSNSLFEVSRTVYAMHYFIFGRNNPHYQRPTYESLMIPQEDC